MRILIAAALFVSTFSAAIGADDTANAINAIRAVQPGAVDSAAARKAVQQLAAGGSESLLPLLNGFHDASPLAVNWLRNAFEQIVDAETKAGHKLPQKELEAFVTDQQQSPFARRLVYETLKRSDASVEDRLIPDMLLDASSEFRRDAVARLIKAIATHTQLAGSKFKH